MPEELQQNWPIGNQRLSVDELSSQPERRSLEELLYGGTASRQALSDLPYRVTLLLAGLLPVLYFGVVLTGIPPTTELELRIASGVMLVALIIVAIRCNYFLSSRIEQMQQRIPELDVIMLLVNDESRLFSDPHYHRIIRRLERRSLDPLSPRGRTAIVGRELAYMLGITRRPSSTLFASLGLLLAAALAFGIAIYISGMHVWEENANTLLNSISMLGSMLLIKLATQHIAMLAGCSLLRRHVRSIQHQDNRRRDSGYV